MLYQVKSEQVSLAKQLTRSAIILALTFLGAVLIHRLWFAKSPWALWENFSTRSWLRAHFSCSIHSGANTRLKSRMRRFRCGAVCCWHCTRCDVVVSTSCANYVETFSANQP